MFFLNQEINQATTSNPESKSKPRVKEHEHQRTWTLNQQKKKIKKKKKKTLPNQRTSTRANTGKPTRNHTQTKPSKE